MAPKLLTEIRCRSHPKPPPPSDPSPFKARPVNSIELDSGILQWENLKTHPLKAPHIAHALPGAPRTYTVPHPFTFASDKIAEIKMREFERKVRQQMLEEEKARRFKAQPMPSFSPKLPPRVPRRPLTVPKPFVFAVEARCSRYQRLMQQKINEEGRKRLNESSSFRARPAPKLAPVPGVRKSTCPPTIPQPVVLRSEQRMQFRRQFEEKLRQKTAEQERIRT
ncbi:hypothetical protein L0F63_005755 [Massospora cicadina]|nr:hypothetical protein L0F63_005755 [Massospora cicadina]